jgi:hypothetical protein
MGSKQPARMRLLVFCWLSALVFTYSFLFLIGKLVLLEYAQAAIAAAAAGVSMLLLLWLMGKTRILK